MERSKDSERIKELIAEMTAHPEGGYFRRHFESSGIVVRNENTVKKLSAITATYFLLTKENFSALHKLQSDEIWHFYEGAPLLIHIIFPPTDEHPHGLH